MKPSKKIAAHNFDGVNESQTLTANHRRETVHFAQDFPFLLQKPPDPRRVSEGVSEGSLKGFRRVLEGVSRGPF